MRTLAESLSSIKKQIYKGGIEIIIVDGGSDDGTIELARKYKAKVISNPLMTGEAGKALGAKAAKGEILAFIDSDNILADRFWFKKMIEPFIEDSDIIASEPLYFTYRKSDSWLTRYFALLGMGDPLSLFIGYYDRYSYISNTWTELAIGYEEKKDYLLLELKDQLPTMGANGFVIKSAEIKKYPIRDYLFDVDVLYFLIKEKGVIKVAKVKTGVVHLFSGNIWAFIRKQRRRFRDFRYYRKQGIRAGYDNKLVLKGVLKFILACILVVPVLVQCLRGYQRKKDFCWLAHPVVCYLTLFVYAYEFAVSFFKSGAYNRKYWKQ
jgi:glycosyltransferase involved in cell wall biosynthesis